MVARFSFAIKTNEISMIVSFDGFSRLLAQDLGIQGSRSPGISEPRDLGVQGSRSPGISESRDLGIQDLGIQDFGIEDLGIKDVGYQDA